MTTMDEVRGITLSEARKEVLMVAARALAKAIDRQLEERQDGTRLDINAAVLVGELPLVYTRGNPVAGTTVSKCTITLTVNADDAQFVTDEEVRQREGVAEKVREITAEQESA